MPKRLAIASIALLALMACGEGSFDQRMRADVDELRDGAFDFVNTNPGSGFGNVIGDVSTGGPATFARVTLHAVSLDGVIDWDVNNALGDSFSSGIFGEFDVTMRREYSGPIIVSAVGAELSGQKASYGSPSRAESNPRFDFAAGDELVGYVLDYPFVTDAIVVSPLSTLVVERAQFLGGVSSGNLALAAQQVGVIFGLEDARDRRPDNIMNQGGLRETLEENLAFAAISQIAKDFGVADAAIWRALRLDMRDDGELNASFATIDGSEAALPALNNANVLGAILTDRMLALGNDDNRTGVNAGNLPSNPPLNEAIQRLNAPRSAAMTMPPMTDLVVHTPVLTLKAGQMTSLGVRGFERRGEKFWMLFSSDGPTVATVSYSADRPADVSFPHPGIVAVSAGVASGTEITVSVRVQADGVHLSGAFDQSVNVLIRVID
ncbi:MAG: hypothetical protein KDB07_02695 [Planctomycetes bacterium]|nr:hypothetical protein [Planctomycetota bacterium]